MFGGGAVAAAAAALSCNTDCGITKDPLLPLLLWERVGITGDIIGELIGVLGAEKEVRAAEA